jgi:uncharacterized protein (DUF58 family)
VLTRGGWGTLIGSAVLYTAGFLLGYEEPVVLAVGGALALAVASLWTLPQARLDVRREVTPVKVARGDPAVAVLRVKNDGRWALSGMRARDRFGATEQTVDLPRLPRRAARTVTYPLPTGTRGEIPVGPLRLLREDPLGLTRRVREYGASAVLLVRPRTVALAVLPSGRAHHLEGPTSDTAPSGTTTFHTLREYVVGDDLRHVHWRSSARTGTLMVRQLIDASLPTTTVVLDTRTASYREAEHFELAVDCGASVAVVAARAGFPVRLMTGEDLLLDLKGGGSDAETLLDRLARVSLSEGTTPDLVRLARPGGSLVVVTGDSAQPGRVAAVRRRYDRVLCLRVSPAGDATSVPGIRVLDVHDLDQLTTAWTGAAR